MSFLIDRTRLLTAAVLLLLSLSLTGCTRIQTSIEDLMSPPVLTEEQAQIRPCAGIRRNGAEVQISAKRRVPFFLYFL